MPQRGHYAERDGSYFVSDVECCELFTLSKHCTQRLKENILLVKQNDEVVFESEGDSSRLDPLTIKITDFGLAKFLGNEGLRTYCGMYLLLLPPMSKH